MYKIKVVDIQKVHHQESNSDFLDVSVEIVDAEGEVVSFQKHAFDPSIEKEALKEAIDKMLSGYILEQEQKVANAESEKVNKHVGNLQEELVGSEFGVEETKE